MLIPALILAAVYVFQLLSNYTDLVSNWFPPSGVVVDGLSDNFTGQANGGLTLEEIHEMRDDDNRPVTEDVFKTFYVTETAHYVIVHREVIKVNEISVYPNLLFIKTNKGLIWDGAIKVTAEVPVSWWTAKHNFDKMKVNLNFDLNVQNKLETIDWWEHIKGFGALFYASINADSENVVTFSDFKTSFAKNFWGANAVAALINRDRETALLQNKIRKYLFDNVIEKYFQNFTDLDTHATVELIHGRNEVENLEILNSYVTYIWSQSKTADKSANSTVVDLSHYFDCYIPVALQNNYPIPSELQEQHNGREYYAMYFNKVFGNVYYSYSNNNIKRDNGKATDNASEHFVAPQPEAEEIKKYSKLEIKLNNTNNADLSNLSEIVTIQIGTNLVNFNSVFETKHIAVLTGVELNYNISSENLIFETISGKITVNTTFATKVFNFSYYENQVPVLISLNNLSSVDLGEIDLSVSPVLIVLSNSENTYQFNFNSNVLLNEQMTRLVYLETYNYTILSNQLIFATNSGVLEISASNRIFVFNFAVPQSQPYVAILSDTIFSAPNSNALFFNYTNNTAVNVVSIKLTVYNLELDTVYISNKELVYSAGVYSTTILPTSGLMQGVKYSFQIQVLYENKQITSNILEAFWSYDGRVFDLKINNK